MDIEGISDALATCRAFLATEKFSPNNPEREEDARRAARTLVEAKIDYALKELPPPPWPG